MRKKKAMFSLFEVAFALILITGVSFYAFYSTDNDISKTSSYHLQSKTFLHTYNFTQTQRDIIFSENLSQESITQNWTTITSNFSKEFFNYGLYVGNITEEKQIKQCSNNISNNKFSSQKLMLSNKSVYSQKTLRLEVCY